ncbi:MAG: DUF1587 domain-containing protein [Planctomycetaceae bacterium]
MRFLSRNLPERHGRLRGCIGGRPTLVWVVTAAHLFAGGLADAQLSEPADGFFKTHCIRCHGAEVQEGGVRLDLLAGFGEASELKIWGEVLDQLHRGEMPPPDEAQPSAEQLETVSDWISDELRKVSVRQAGTGGRSLLRRLNRAEYTNAVRDLLSVDFLPGEGPADLLPPDGRLNGFDKVSRAGCWIRR